MKQNKKQQQKIYKSYKKKKLRKQKGYTLFENISYALKKHWRLNKPTIGFCVIAVIVQVLQPFLGLLLPKLVIDQIMTNSDVKSFLLVVGGSAILLIIVSSLKSYTDIIVNDSIGTLSIFDETNLLLEKEMYIDYELLEDPEVKKVYDKAKSGLQSNHSLANNILRLLVNTLVNLFGLILFGIIVVVTKPIIIVLLIASAVISWLFLSIARKYRDRNRDEESDKHRNLRYMQDTLMKPEGSKDIRMYGMNSWLTSTINRFMSDAHKVSARINWRKTHASLVDALLILLRDGAAYAYLILMLLNNQITLGNFVLVFAAIGGFTYWISTLIVQASDLLKASSEMNDIRAYYSVEDRFNTDVGKPISLDHAPSIRLIDIGYTYANTVTPTLEGVDIDIYPGERIAIVGANGAGKTTLIKLIVGLYMPKTGRVEVDGTNTNDFNRDDYFKMFSAVFQDIHILAESIAQNISQAPIEETDMMKVKSCLKRVGLYDRVQGLKDKENTMMVAQINEDAIAFSGGEMQKLALARALYKDAPIIILDEPTAALDPIAESEVYAQYAELTEGKTSIYISHRLASTRFCDRILFIDEHRVIEQGSHTELMSLGGRYANMFTLQAHYYRNDNEGKEETT